MVSLDFTTGLNHYGYDVGVNAANLTYDDITRANARLKPFRQQRIRNGLLKATRDEASTIAPAPAVATADTSHLVHYAKWTKKELVKAILGRQLKSATKAKSMYVCSQQTKSQQTFHQRLNPLTTLTGLNLTWSPH